MLALVPRRLVFLPLLLWQVWSATILSYYEYFERPLSLQTVKSSFGEGAAVAGVGLELLGGKLVFALTVAFLLKSTLAFAARSASVRIWKTGLFAIVAWGLLSAVILHFHPFRLLKTTFNFEKAAAAYGYFWTWVGEEIYLGDELLERAIEAARTRTSNQLADEVPPPPADRVVIIQVESLDDSIVGHVVEGVTIVPFLTSLQETSMHYKVRAIHDNGSADADFSMLTGLHPSPDVITYRLLNYPYADTLPKIFSRAGYHTESMHGLYGSFFERRVVFEGPMGFDDVIFEEELVKDYGLVPGRWGVRDREMMRVAADRLLAHEGKIFQFIITLSSHSPFDFIDPEDEEIARGPSTGAGATSTASATPIERCRTSTSGCRRGRSWSSTAITNRSRARSPGMRRARRSSTSPTSSTRRGRSSAPPIPSGRGVGASPSSISSPSSETMH